MKWSVKSCSVHCFYSSLYPSLLAFLLYTHMFIIIPYDYSPEYRLGADVWLSFLLTWRSWLFPSSFLEL